jgi:DinB superfamily
MVVKTESEPVDYTTLSLPAVIGGLDDVARDAESTFGGLRPHQLNWRPDATRWSVAQCFEHLCIANGLMLDATKDAVTGRAPRTIWQRIPFVPGMIGKMMVRSQSPQPTRRFTAPPAARPASSEVGADVIARFVQQQREAAAWLRSVDEGTAVRTVMTSPFIKVITYSVLDGCRLMLTHDRRHFEQARRVMTVEGFPRL